MQIKRSITKKLQTIGETFYQAWNRYYAMIMKVPNNGFHENLVIQYFYNGINDETKEMIDLSAGGAICNLTLPECVKLFKVRSFNDEQYNLVGDIKPRKGMSL